MSDLSLVVEPPTGKTSEQMLAALRESDPSIPERMPARHIEDLYRNRFHGSDLPSYDEVVVDGVIYPRGKEPGAGEPKPGEQEASE